MPILLWPSPVAPAQPDPKPPWDGTGTAVSDWQATLAQRPDWAASVTVRADWSERVGQEA